MDFTYEGMLISVENVPYVRKQQIDRLWTYYNKLAVMHVKKVSLDENVQQVGFWDKESNLEKKIFRKMKKWEMRHPITGIILCTILGGIFISLVAGIILEVIMMML